MTQRKQNILQEISGVLSIYRQRKKWFIRDVWFESSDLIFFFLFKVLYDKHKSNLSET